MTRGKNDYNSENAKQLLKMIGTRIKFLREAKGEYNYERFAFKHDLNRSQLWRYENGEDMYVSSLLKVLAALDISLSDFLTKALTKLPSEHYSIFTMQNFYNCSLIKSVLLKPAFISDAKPFY